MADVLLGETAQDEGPEYELPAEVARDTDSDLPPEPVADPTDPGQSDAAAAPTAAAPPAPDAAAAPAPAAPPASPTDPVLEHPAFKALVAQNQRLAAIVERIAQPAEPAAPAAPPAPERPQADLELEERMIQRIPWLAGVREFFANAERLEHLDRLAAAAPQVQDTFATHAEQTADFAFNRVVEQFAAARGVAATAVSEGQQKRLVMAFINEIQGDPGRARRFQLGDRTVVDEALRDVFDTFGLQVPQPQSAPLAGATPPPAAPAPQVVPAQVVGIAQRVASAASLPRAGVAPGAPAPVTPAAGGEDEDDAVHDRGWAAVVNARR